VPHRHGLRAVQNGGRHDGAVFCEGAGPTGRSTMPFGTGHKLRPVRRNSFYSRRLRIWGRRFRLQVLEFRSRELKAEITGKSFRVAFHGLIENFGGDTVQLRQVRIQNHLLVAEVQNQGFDWFLGLHDTLIS
jgi:hypothetical protein